ETYEFESQAEQREFHSSLFHVPRRDESHCYLALRNRGTPRGLSLARLTASHSPSLMAGHPRRIPPIGLSMLGASPSAQLAASAFRSEALTDREHDISDFSASPS